MLDHELPVRRVVTPARSPGSRPPRSAFPMILSWVAWTQVLYLICR